VPASFLALASSAAWGSADFFAGLKTRTLGLLTVVLLSQAFGWAFAGVLVVAAGNPAPEGRALGLSVAAGVLGAVGISALYKALAVGKMGIVAPIAATSAAIPVAAGLAQGERPGNAQLVGMAVALVGVVLAARERDPETDDRRLAAGVGYALLAAVSLGTLFVFLDAASNRDVVWAVFTLRSTSLVILAAAALFVRPSLPTRARDWGLLVGIGVLDNGANALFALASTRGLLSLAAVLGSLYPVVTAVLARTVLHERISRTQLVGITAAIAGVVLIAI
jgi:drug/metabolite transporter (DMT)-like permease